MANYSLVTGSTSGIGFEVAKLLANHSVNLVLHGRDTSKLSEHKALLKNANVVLWQHDFNDIETIPASLQALIAREKISITKLVHCVGMDATLPARSTDIELIDKLMRVNFYSAVAIIKLLLKKSINKQGLANILLTSSVSAIRGFSGKSAYSASKAALDAYMLSLSKELAPRTRVNSVLPGAVPTNMTADIFADDAHRQHLLESYPLGAGSAVQVAEVIASYHNNDNLWVTGQRIVVDGGSTS